MRHRRLEAAEAERANSGRARARACARRAPATRSGSAALSSALAPRQQQVALGHQHGGLARPCPRRAPAGRRPARAASTCRSRWGRRRRRSRRARRAATPRPAPRRRGCREPSVRLTPSTRTPARDWLEMFRGSCTGASMLVVIAPSAGITPQVRRVGAGGFIQRRYLSRLPASPLGEGSRLPARADASSRRSRCAGRAVPARALRQHGHLAPGAAAVGADAAATGWTVHGCGSLHHGTRLRGAQSSCGQVAGANEGEARAIAHVDEKRDGRLPAGRDHSRAAACEVRPVRRPAQHEPRPRDRHRSACWCVRRPASFVWCADWGCCWARRRRA